MSQPNYPELYDRLRGGLRIMRKDIPGPMSGFAQLHTQAMADGAPSST